MQQPTRNGRAGGGEDNNTNNGGSTPSGRARRLQRQLDAAAGPAGYLDPSAGGGQPQRHRHSSRAGGEEGYGGHRPRAGGSAAPSPFDSYDAVAGSAAAHLTASNSLVGPPTTRFGLASTLLGGAGAGGGGGGAHSPTNGFFRAMEASNNRYSGAGAGAGAGRGYGSGGTGVPPVLLKSPPNNAAALHGSGNGGATRGSHNLSPHQQQQQQQPPSHLRRGANQQQQQHQHTAASGSGRRMVAGDDQLFDDSYSGTPRHDNHSSSQQRGGGGRQHEQQQPTLSSSTTGRALQPQAHYLYDTTPARRANSSSANNVYTTSKRIRTPPPSQSAADLSVFSSSSSSNPHDRPPEELRRALIEEATERRRRRNQHQQEEQQTPRPSGGNDKGVVINGRPSDALLDDVARAELDEAERYNEGYTYVDLDSSSSGDDDDAEDDGNGMGQREAAEAPLFGAARGQVAGPRPSADEEDLLLSPPSVAAAPIGGIGRVDRREKQPPAPVAAPLFAARAMADGDGAAIGNADDDAVWDSPLRQQAQPQTTDTRNNGGLQREGSSLPLARQGAENPIVVATIGEEESFEKQSRTPAARKRPREGAAVGEDNTIGAHTPPPSLPFSQPSPVPTPASQQHLPATIKKVSNSANTSGSGRVDKAFVIPLPPSRDPSAPPPSALALAKSNANAHMRGGGGGGGQYEGEGLGGSSGFERPPPSRFERPPPPRTSRLTGTTSSSAPPDHELESGAVATAASAGRPEKLLVPAPLAGDSHGSQPTSQKPPSQTPPPSPRIEAITRSPRLPRLAPMTLPGGDDNDGDANGGEWPLEKDDGDPIDDTVTVSVGGGTNLLSLAASASAAAAPVTNSSIAQQPTRSNSSGNVNGLGSRQPTATQDDDDDLCLAAVAKDTRRAVAAAAATAGRASHSAAATHQQRFNAFAAAAARVGGGGPNAAATDYAAKRDSIDLEAFSSARHTNTNNVAAPADASSYSYSYSPYSSYVPSIGRSSALPAIGGAPPRPCATSYTYSSNFDSGLAAYPPRPSASGPKLPLRPPQPPLPPAPREPAPPPRPAIIDRSGFINVGNSCYAASVFTMLLRNRAVFYHLRQFVAQAAPVEITRLRRGMQAMLTDLDAAIAKKKKASAEDANNSSEPFSECSLDTLVTFRHNVVTIFGLSSSAAIDSSSVDDDLAWFDVKSDRTTANITAFDVNLLVPAEVTARLKVAAKAAPLTVPQEVPVPEADDVVVPIREIDAPSASSASHSLSTSVAATAAIISALDVSEDLSLSIVAPMHHQPPLPPPPPPPPPIADDRVPSTVGGGGRDSFDSAYRPSYGDSADAIESASSSLSLVEASAIPRGRATNDGNDDDAWLAIGEEGGDDATEADLQPLAPPSVGEPLTSFSSGELAMGLLDQLHAESNAEAEAEATTVKKPGAAEGAEQRRGGRGWDWGRSGWRRGRRQWGFARKRGRLGG